MTKKLLLFFFIFVCINGTPGLLGWGFFAHKEITKTAITYLPDSIAVWYNKNHTELVTRSVEPDQNRYSDKSEVPRHYIDLENYNPSDFKTKLIPYSEFTAKYKSALILDSGYLPYVILQFMDSLTLAVRSDDERGMVKFSSYLSHYIADLHVPFHTTIRYDGSGTTKGIHSRFESDLADRILGSHKHPSFTAEYVKNPEESVFAAMKQSHSFVDQILTSDSLVQYQKGIAGKKTKDRFDDDYYQLLNVRVGSIVTKQVSASSKMVADLWLTCWINAANQSGTSQ